MDKVELRRKFIAFNDFTRKKETSEINDLYFHLKKVENEQGIRSKTNRRKEIIKVKGKNNEIRTGKKSRTLMKLKVASFKKSIKLVNF